MLADLRHALRALRRAPGYVLAAALCLGLGLGANALVFSLVDALLLRPLPFAGVDRLVDVQLAKPALGGGGNSLSLPYVLDLRARSRTLGPVAAYAGRTVSLAGTAAPAAVSGAEVSAEFFQVLGVRPLLGRAFRPDESAPGAPRVVVLAEPLWRERFAADRAVVGRAVAIDGAPATVVGVMPEGVGLTGDREQLWVPLAHRADERLRNSYYLSGVARLAPGATLAAARAEMRGIARQILADHPDADPEWVPAVAPLRERLVPQEITAVFAAMFGAVAFVLLIACANVANLLLVRTTGRSREFAVRAALGAARWRVVRLVVVEGVLVALLGGALGVALAWGGVRALVRGIDVAYPSWIRFAVDGRVLAYAFALATVVGVGVAALPALGAARAGLAGRLRDGARGTTAGGRRVRDGFVVAQLALTLVLLAGAGLLVKDVLRRQRKDPGFEARGLLLAKLFVTGERYQGDARRLALVSDALQRLRALPGVTDAVASNLVPFAGGGSTGGFVAEGHEVPAGREPWAHRRAVWGGYFRTLRTPLVAGREFTAEEGRDSLARVVLVNQALARRYFPDGRAVGRRITLGRAAAPHPVWRTVVGVVPDAPLTGLGARPDFQVYVPYARAASWSHVMFLVRGPDAAALAPAVRRAFAAVDPTLPVVQLETMTAVANASLWRDRLFGTLFSTFGAAALALAVVGVYGVVAYTVAERTREMGVRLALGARAADVRRLVLGGSARRAAWGLAVGLPLAVALTRVLRSALVDVSPTDPVVLGGVAAALVGATLLAAWAPARRAARVDPVVALRAE